ncbi:maltotransferase domain-containing protein [Paracraurococcus lichenis]|uniref:Alpha-1,4-glucan:maltose-1-phosphate maltosyltransferase n=1 Tax=Paracraurococcus lichenis TaxID=3064888 RepID=A0ABT9DYL3_9PROT|nr:maltotransferase domain-containing protein [Paracraurococcus sp. LOR1-02]MDO9708995.1 DUF3416 domain-containing protein [Paracraurococcus sp. LOR1-02]
MASRRGGKPKATARAVVEEVVAAPPPAPPVPAPEPAPLPSAPRLYYLHPLLVGPLPAWDAAFARVAALGFDAVLLAPPFAPGPSGNLFHLADPEAPHPILEAPGDAASALAELAGKARAAGLALHLDIVLDRVAEDGAFRARHPGWFAGAEPGTAPDPRQTPPERGTARARWEDPAVAEALGGWWEARLRRLAEAGVAGFRCDAPHRVPPATWRRLTAALPDCRFMAWTAGIPAPDLAALAGCGFAAVFDSLGWWDLEGAWLVEEAARLAAIAPVISTVEPPFGPRLAARDADAWTAERAATRHLRLASGMGAGILVPMGFEYGARRPLDAARDRPGDWAWLQAHGGFDLSPALRAANAALADRGLGRAELRPLSGFGAPVTALLRAGAPDVRQASTATLVLANPDLRAGAGVAIAALLPGTGGSFTRFRPLSPPEGEALTATSTVQLAPGEVRLFEAEAAPPVLDTETGPAEAAAREAAAPDRRIGIEAVTPSVEGGRFPVKRTVGEVVEVTCDLICDGHEKLGAALLWRAADEHDWTECRMTPLGNDRWMARFPLERMGRHAFVIETWHDAFATFRDELEKKHAANVPIGLELEEGRILVTKAGERAGGALSALAERLQGAPDQERLTILLSRDMARLMAAADDRPFRVRSPEMPLDAERTGAGFASWYELFPRSQSGDAARHGTFDDVIGRLPHIRAMGFDVLYFPPIHPIGRAFRKGRNNTLTPGPEDPGSPYAIGSEEGGHDAIHPQLGTLEDFRRLVDAAREQGLELALDFAVQCSPDHPWLREHRDWFDWRPDGSIKYAENPPKKYQDIVNVDFYNAGAVPSLWVTLRNVVQFWVDNGVRLFRVDNPHTKPFPFWEWLIGDIRSRHPDAVFLAEAFTRPKVMYRLAKIGFSQSYTYFTWRNEKPEITEYLTELSTTAPRDFFRPHFFVNTPDINPPFLQTGGRAAHLIRAALATTLSGLWGMYQGFELCEATPLPGREEYLDSEKYEIRVWPDRRPGDIVDEITRLNMARRANPALQTHLGVAFHNAFNDQVLWYRKATPDRGNVVLCAVSLDPFNVQEAAVELPLWEWGLPDHAALEAEDLMTGRRFTWRGKVQRLRLDPGALPFGLWRVRPAEGA